MIAFQTSIRIEQRVEPVFAYLADPQNLPAWNSAVRTVQRTLGKGAEVGSRYVMERELPTGEATNELEVVAREDLKEFAIRTTSGPTPFAYRYRLEPADSSTTVELDAEVELSGAVSLLGPLARHAIKSGVNENLATLKAILEAHQQTLG